MLAKHYFVIICLLILIQEIQPFTYLLDPGVKLRHCIYKSINTADIFNMSYVLTGAHYLDKVHSELFDPNDRLIFNDYKSDNGKLNDYAILIEGKYKLCFTPITNSKMYINVEFHIKSETGELKELAKDGKYYYIII